jgi:hypothetical protein
MANIDKTLTVVFCPICGTAKETDVLIEAMSNELGPKFHCGTIVWPFQKLVKVQGAKCRILQKMRAPKPTEDLSTSIGRQKPFGDQG